jgi:serine/threonine protein phosphatase PrpC
MFQISSAAISDRGLSEKRPENEDAYLELEDFRIYAVADGVGGAQAGDVASQMAVEILGEAFMNLRPGADPESVMLSAIEKANSAIQQMAKDLPQLSSMATTVVALHINGNIATIGHVGDSRLYRVDRNGNFYRETNDHSMVAEEVRAGRMTEEQAENHPSRNIISRALGAEESVSVDLKTLMIDGGTAFLLCSDGITRHVSDQEIKGVLTFGGSPSDICEYLKDLCYHRGAEDNLTAVVVKTASSGAGQKGGDHSPNRVLIPDHTETDETTIASVRAAVAGTFPSDQDETDLLELETGARPEVINSPARVENITEFTEFTEEDRDIDETPREPDFGEETVPDFRIEPPPSKIGEIELDGQKSDNAEFTIFGSSNVKGSKRENRTASKALAAIGFLVLGAVIGIGTYYFAIAPRPVDTDGPRLTEMRAANIPLSAFEENRRNVDKDPANYIARFSNDPQDCEDFYLLGRAYLLTGDYSNAKASLTEARNRLSEADPTNAAVLASDIAIAMSVTNDTTVRSMLRKELETTIPVASQTPANINSNN